MNWLKSFAFASVTPHKSMPPLDRQATLYPCLEKAPCSVVPIPSSGQDRVIDDRPIRILGGRVAKRLENRVGPLARPHLLAVVTDVMVKSEAVRRQVLAAGNDKDAEVLLWGRHHPTNLNCTFVAARHRPSAAAHVFKSQALAAGGALVSQQADEGFYSLA